MGRDLVMRRWAGLEPGWLAAGLEPGGPLLGDKHCRYQLPSPSESFPVPQQRGAGVRA